MEILVEVVLESYSKIILFLLNKIYITSYESEKIYNFIVMLVVIPLHPIKSMTIEHVMDISETGTGTYSPEKLENCNKILEDV